MGFEVVVGRQDSGTEKFLLQDVDELQEVLRLAAADVVNSVRRDRQSVFTVALFGCFFHHSHNALNDVVHVGEIPEAVAVIVDLDGLAFQKLVGEAEVSHVRATCRAIDGEEAQACAGDIVEFRIAMCEELIAFLGGGIEADRVIHHILHGKRHFLVTAIHAARRGIDEVFHRVVTTSFKDVVEADDVAFDIHPRVFDRVTNASLGGEVDHHIELIVSKKLVDKRLVGNRAFEKLIVYPIGDERFKFLQTILFQTYIIVSIKIIDVHNSCALHVLKQALYQVAADKSGTTCN